MASKQLTREEMLEVLKSIKNSYLWHDTVHDIEVKIPTVHRLDAKGIDGGRCGNGKHPRLQSVFPDYREFIAWDDMNDTGLKYYYVALHMLMVGQDHG
jgi:hypothetical protein